MEMKQTVWIMDQTWITSIHFSFHISMSKLILPPSKLHIVCSFNSFIIMGFFAVFFFFSIARSLLCCRLYKMLFWFVFFLYVIMFETNKAQIQLPCRAHRGQKNRTKTLIAALRPHRIASTTWAGANVSSSPCQVWPINQLGWWVEDAASFPRAAGTMDASHSQVHSSQRRNRPWGVFLVSLTFAL